MPEREEVKRMTHDDTKEQRKYREHVARMRREGVEPMSFNSWVRAYRALLVDVKKILRDGGTR